MTNVREKFIDTREHCMDLNSTDIAVQSLDYSGSIIDVSPAWLELMGYKPEEVIGRHFFEFLDMDVLLHVNKCFPHLKDYGYVDHVPLKICCKGGDVLSVSLNGTSEYNEQGEFERTYCEIQCKPANEEY